MKFEDATAEPIAEVMAAAEEIGIKLESHAGSLTWELMPSPLHTIAVTDIQLSVQPVPGKGCACRAYPDMYIRFPDGSFKRPDLALYCEPVPRTLTAATILPGAVVEAISAGSETKDLQLNPPFYMAHGVKDVVVLDPITGQVSHWGPHGFAVHRSPVVLSLAMGCEITV